jgi:hypothetical protein
MTTKSHPSLDRVLLIIWLISLLFENHITSKKVTAVTWHDTGLIEVKAEIKLRPMLTVRCVIYSLL